MNVSDQPTYFMALKDSAGLVKMYAMVNVQQYQVVSTGYSLAECQQNYHQLLLKNEIIEDIGESSSPSADLTEETATASGIIDRIRWANIDGNTIFYLRLEGETVYYTVSAKDYPITAVLDTGDSITVEYLLSDNILLEVRSLKVE